MAGVDKENSLVARNQEKHEDWLQRSVLASSANDLSRDNSITLPNAYKTVGFGAARFGLAVSHISVARAWLSGAPLVAQFLDVFNGLSEIMI